MFLEVREVTCRQRISISRYPSSFLVVYHGTSRNISDLCRSLTLRNYGTEHFNGI